MRAAAIVVWLIVLVAAAPLAAQTPAADRQGLADFARRIGLHDVDAFVDVVLSLHSDHRLPAGYVTKGDAKAHGWHGGGLCTLWPGRMIGGDVFHNFAGRLPAMPGRIYREADLDATCRSRGPKRLIFSNDGLIYVTIDHYNTFLRVP